VGLVEACEDPSLFGVPLTDDQRVRLRWVETTRTSVWAVGRRGIKTTSMAYVGLWACLLRRELHAYLRPRERGYSVGVATNTRQARLMISAAHAVIEESPLLTGMVENVTEDQIDFVNGMSFAAFPCTSRGGRGWPVHTLLLDEVAFMLDNDGNVSAEAVVRALLPATAQFGDLARVVFSSTPWGEDGVFAEMFQKARSGELDDAYAHQATTKEANPSISPEFLQAEERRDPESYKSEYLARFVGSGGAFFDPDNVAAAVSLRGELRPRRRHRLGGRSGSGVLV
jgi:hypothetical protein